MLGFGVGDSAQFVVTLEVCQNHSLSSTMVFSLGLDSFRVIWGLSCASLVSQILSFLSFSILTQQDP